jgi:hypothetical protein
MRNGPIDVTAWELEAARRREVIKADFVVTHEPLEARRPRPGRGPAPLRRLAGWVAALAQGNTSPSGNRVDRASGCQQSVGAIEPGS